MDLDKMDRKEHFRSSLRDENEAFNQDKGIETEHEDNLNLKDDKKELQKDNIERVDESQISIENERFDEETINNAGGMNTVKYRTKEVANILGVSEQTIRNNAAFFEPYLNIEKAESGHRRYGRDSIDKLRLIFQLKKDKKFTNEQVIEYLQGDNLDYADLSPEKKLDIALSMITKTIQSVIEDTATSLLQSNEKMIEQQNNEYNENLRQNTELIKHLSEKLLEKDEFISSLRDDKDELLRQNEEFKKKINEMEKKSNENQELIMEELEKLKKEERPQKKKWSFWK